MQIGRESILIIMGEVFRCWGVRHLPFLVIQPLRILLFITGLLLFHKTCLLSSNERFPPPSTFIHPFFSLPPQHTAKCYFPHPAMFGGIPSPSSLPPTPAKARMLFTWNAPNRHEMNDFLRWSSDLLPGLFRYKR